MKNVICRCSLLIIYETKVDEYLQRTLLSEEQQLSDTEVLAKFIRAARTNSDLTIHDATAICNVSVSTMTNLENAKADVKFSTVLKVCKMFGITLRIEA